MPDKGAVLITGASTGIGRDAALRLTAMGYQVYASVRKEEDAEALRQAASENLHPVFLDVTDSDSIAAALTCIEQDVGEAGLGALVNNAGVNVPGPIEYVTDEEWQWQFDVNVFGLARVTRACLPLLRKAKGRIVNVSSIAGLSASPFLGVYGASKFAVEGMSDALRIELYSQGIPVSLIEPGPVKTAILDKAQKQMEEAVARIDEEGQRAYADLIKFVEGAVEGAGKRAVEPSKVTDAIIDALTSRYPKARYLVGPDAKIRIWFERMPTGVRDFIIRTVTGVKRR